jgi:hypothetical protein
MERAEFFLTPESYKRIEGIFVDVNSCMVEYTDDVLTLQLKHIFDNMAEDKLEILSPVFFKLIALLQVSSICQIQRHISQGGTTREISFPNLEKNFIWCHNILQVITVAKLKLKLKDPKLIKELSFDAVINNDLYNFARTVRFIAKILAANPKLEVEDKNSIKLFLLNLKNTLNKLEEDMIMVFNQTNQNEPFNVSGLFSNPLKIDEIIRDYLL